MLMQHLEQTERVEDDFSPLPSIHSPTFLPLHFLSARLRVRMKCGTCEECKEIWVCLPPKAAEFRIPLSLYFYFFFPSFDSRN